MQQKTSLLLQNSLEQIRKIPLRELYSTVQGFASYGTKARESKCQLRAWESAERLWGSPAISLHWFSGVFSGVLPSSYSGCAHLKSVEDLESWQREKGTLKRMGRGSLPWSSPRPDACKYFMSTLHCLQGLWVKNQSCYSQFNFIQAEGQIPRGSITSLKVPKHSFFWSHLAPSAKKTQYKHFYFLQVAPALKWTLNTLLFARIENQRGRCICGYILGGNPHVSQNKIYLF